MNKKKNELKKSLKEHKVVFFPEHKMKKEKKKLFGSDDLLEREVRLYNIIIFIFSKCLKPFLLIFNGLKCCREKLQCGHK